MTWRCDFIGIFRYCLTAPFLVVLGCSNLPSLEHPKKPQMSQGEGGELIQQGELWMRAESQKYVVYPNPYASPPRLEIKANTDEVRVIEQKAKRFRLRNTNRFSETVRWRARGIPMSPQTQPAEISPH
jgi:hypothetical protein